MCAVSGMLEAMCEITCDLALWLKIPYTCVGTSKMRVRWYMKRGFELIPIGHTPQSGNRTKSGSGTLAPSCCIAKTAVMWCALVSASCIPHRGRQLMQSMEIYASISTTSNKYAYQSNYCPTRTIQTRPQISPPPQQAASISSCVFMPKEIQRQTPITSYFEPHW